TFVSNKVFGFLAKRYIISKIFYSCIQLVKLNINNKVYMLFFKRIKYNNIIYPVDELRRKGLFKRTFYNTLRVLICLGFFSRGTKTNSLAKVLKLPCTNIRRHNDYRIPEINLTA